MSKDVDPRIRAFSRQAAAIVVAEGGLSAECQAKLRSVAQHLRMSDVEFLEALTEVQSVLPLTHELSRYELIYVNFLKKEFARLASNILTLPIENRALELAASKYQIGLARARQLLEGTCDELGIHRISASDAEGFIEQALNEMVGTEIFLSSEQTDRLHALAKSWGISRERMDELIDLTLAANWRLKQVIRRRKLARRCFWSLTAIGVVGITFYVVRVFLNRDPQQQNSPMAANVPRNSEPEWWPRKLSESAAAVLVRQPELQAALATAAHSPVESRLALYREWARNISQFPEDESIAAADLLFEIAVQDPDAAARWLDRQMLRSLVIPRPNDLRVGTLMAQANGWRMVEQWRKLQPDFGVDVDTEIRALLELRSESDYEAAQKQGLHNYWLGQQWTRLTSLTEGEPTQSLVLARTLLHLLGFDNRNPQFLATANRLASDVLLRHPDRLTFEVIAADLSDLLKQVDDLQLERWLEVAARFSDYSTKQTIYAAISQKLELEIDSFVERDLIKAMESRKLELRRKRLHSIVQINELATAAEKNVFASFHQGQFELIPHDQLPDGISSVMRTVNLSLLAWLATKRESAGSDSVSELLQNSAHLFFGPPLRLPNDNSASLVTRADEKRALQSLLMKIGESDPDNAGLRIAAVKQLVDRAATIEELNRSEAQQLAQYFLRDLELAERIAAEQAVLTFRKWPQFILALADEIESSKIAREEALSLAQLIRKQDFQLNESQPWQSQLKQALLEYVFNQLESETAQEISLRRQRWQKFQRFVQQAYSFRCEILTGQVPPLETESLVIGIAARLVNGQNTTDSSELLAAALRRKYSNEFARTIPVQREFLLAIANRFGQADVQSAEQINDELREIDSGKRSVAMMFLQQELLLMKSLAGFRQTAFELLMQGGGW
ncbi:MAG: hypothetical protein ABL888_02255 [Pirellulaceae bacterium]